MLINSPNISGSLTVTGNSVITGSLTVLGGINAAITGSATTASYVEYSNIANKPTLVSGSEQVSFNGITDKPTLVSGSSQITYSGISGIPAGIVSGSSQVSFNGITDKPTLVSGSEQVSFNGIVDKPTLVSGSSQVTYSGLSGIPVGIVSGSSQISFNGIVDKPTLVSGSAQVTYSGLSGIPSGIVSSSVQIGEYGIFATTGSNTFVGSQTITGSIFGTGSLTIDGCITATGQIVAQTINVQQVTSSIVYSCGSNIFGTSISNTQQFTGSMLITGSNITANVGSACFQGSVCAAAFVGGTISGTTGNFSGVVTVAANSSANAIAINGRSSDNTGTIDFFQNNGTTRVMEIGISPTAAEFYYDANSPMIFYTNATERLRITAAGIACFACQVCAPTFIGGTIAVGNATNFCCVTSVTSTDALTIISSNATQGIGCYGVGLTFTNNSSGNRRAAIVPVQSAFQADNDRVGLSFFTHPSPTGADPMAEVMRITPESRILIGNPLPTDDQSSILQVNGSVRFCGTVCAPAAIFTGCVGIGITTPPARPLHIAASCGTAYTTSSSGNMLLIANTCAVANSYAGIELATEPAAGNASAAAISVISTGSGNGDLAFTTRGSSVFGERMRITAGGNVGIGTCNPNEKLTVWTSSTTGLQTALRLNNPFGFDNQNTGAQIIFSQDRSVAEDLKQGIIAVGQQDPGTSATSYMAFYTNNTGLGERLRISSTGIACFQNTVCTPLLTVNSAVRLYGSAGGIGCAYIVTATGINEQPAIILEKAGGFGQSEIRTYYNDVPNYGLAFRAGSTTGMYLNSSGNVGIGTSCPTTLLTVRGGYANFTDGTRDIYVGSDGNGGLFGTISNHYQRFVTNNIERMRIFSTGIVNIGCQVCAPTTVITSGFQDTSNMLIISNDVQDGRKTILNNTPVSIFQICKPAGLASSASYSLLGGQLYITLGLRYSGGTNTLQSIIYPFLINSGGTGGLSLVLGTPTCLTGLDNSAGTTFFGISLCGASNTTATVLICAGNTQGTIEGSTIMTVSMVANRTALLDEPISVFKI